MGNRCDGKREKKKVRNNGFVNNSNKKRKEHVGNRVNCGQQM